MRFIGENREQHVQHIYRISSLPNVQMDKLQSTN